MLVVTDTISIPEEELQESFLRAGGPGGQHLNKASTAVQLRFHALNSPSLSPAVKERLSRLAGNRLTGEGVIVIEASAHRSQHRNRREARERLADLIREASLTPPSRRPTRIPRAKKAARLEQKKKRGLLKKLRRKPAPDANE